jgi:hypothetical protein
MADRTSSLADTIEADVAVRWRQEKHRLSQFMKSVGLAGGEHSQALYIFPKMTLHPTQLLDELRAHVPRDEQWALLVGRRNATPTIIAFPVNKDARITSAQDSSGPVYRGSFEIGVVVARKRMEGQTTR